MSVYREAKIIDIAKNGQSFKYATIVSTNRFVPFNGADDGSGVEIRGIKLFEIRNMMEQDGEIYVILGECFRAVLFGDNYQSGRLSKKDIELIKTCERARSYSCENIPGMQPFYLRLR